MPNSRQNISFISANFVARALHYRGPSDWMPHNDATIDKITPEGFLEIVQEIVSAGFEAIDIWTAHCHWQRHNREDFLEQIKGFCSQFDLTITSYAGGAEVKEQGEIDAIFRFMKQLGAPIFAGGLHGPPSPQLCAMVNDACQRFGVRWAFENHPGETSVAEIVERIDGGKHDRIGVALDTGWCGTMGINPLEAAQKLREMDKLFLVHLKDVKKAGEHETCALGEGIVDCEAVVKYLVKSGWQGTFCIEHEPYDRDPMPEIVRSYQRVKEWIA